MACEGRCINTDEHVYVSDGSTCIVQLEMRFIRMNLMRGGVYIERSKRTCRHCLHTEALVVDLLWPPFCTLLGH